jgi:hypothetical protein
MDLAMPVKSVRFNKYKHKSQPWITRGLLKSLSTKDKLYKVFQNCNHPNVKILREQEYKQFRNLYNKLIRAAKENYWKNCFEQSVNDTKRTWKNINYLLNRTENKCNFPKYFLNHDSTLSNTNEIASSFNEYFVNVGPNLAATMPNADLNSVTLPRLNLPNSFALTPTSPIEITSIINKLKPKISKGIDGISPKLVKMNSIIIAEPLSHIANLSFQTGTFPRDMKIAKVTPIFKNKDNRYFKNYRPISLLPTFSKVIERLVYNRLYQYLKINEILTPAQYGFQKNLSTNLAILELQNRILESISNKKWCIGIFLDLSKAFDTLDHDILLHKLSHYGVRGKAFDWFRSYLSNRQQCTEFRSAISSTLDIVCGVPQGSILGPLLFLLYMNDVVQCSSLAKPVLFADDTNLIIDHLHLHELIARVNSELQIIAKWFITNKLSLNVEKTKFIIFRSKTRPLPTVPNLTINNQPIENVSEIKFLGVFIDEYLNWTFHIKSKTAIISKNLAVMNRVKNLIPESTRKTLYYALVHPHLSYGVVAWTNTNSKDMRRVKILQKQAVRLIVQAKYNSHTSPIFKSQKILTIDDILNLECCKLYQKRIKNQLPPYFNNLLFTNSETHNYPTRQQDNIRIPNITTKMQEQYLSVKVARAWNNLPISIKQFVNQSRNSFSEKCHNHFIKQYAVTCNIRNCYLCNRST